MFSSLSLFWEPSTLGILYWLKILAALWVAEMGHDNWSSHRNIFWFWAGGLHKPKPHFCPLSCWQFSLDSWAGRWAGPQKGEEGRARERGTEKGCPWEPLLLVSTSWLSNNHLSQTYCMNWSGWSDPIPLLHLSHHIMYFFMCLLGFFPHRDAQSKYFYPHQLCCPSLNFLFYSSVMFFSRLSDQSCTQCSREKTNSDLCKGTAVPLVIFRVSNICIQRTGPPVLESLRSSQDLMMQFTRCLLKCAVFHSWKTALGEYSLFPSFCSLVANTDAGLGGVSCLVLEFPSLAAPSLMTMVP